MNKYVIKYHSLRLFLAMILIIVSGCGKEKRPELKLMTAPPYPPFEYYAGDKLTGIDIDMMQEIARRLKYELKIQPITFDMVIKSVISGDADAAASSITITKERSKSVLFSVPYIRIGKKIMVLEKSPVRRVEELKNKVVGVQDATTCEPYARKNFKHVVSFPNVEVAAEALEHGKIDALVIDSLTAKCLEPKGCSFRYLPGELMEESHGIAVNMNKPELLQKINKVLADLIRTGWIEQTVKRHVSRSAKREQKKISNEARLKIGIVPSYPPYEFKKNGVIEGIDVDIINYICDELGCTPSFVEINSDTIYQSIAGDDITISISSLTITDARKKIVNFSIPYSEASQRILVRKRSSFRKKEDLKGKPLGVVIGTTSEEQGLQISSEIERYSEPKLLLDALSKNEVDAIVLDDFILKQMIQNSDQFRLLPDILNKEEYGIAVSKHHPELLKKINEILLKMKQNGLLTRIHEKYIRKKNRSSE